MALMDRSVIMVGDVLNRLIQNSLVSVNLLGLDRRVKNVR